jgi:hypothetical protein
MPLESALDFNAYVDTTTGHGVTATFFEVQSVLWDARRGLIDTWFDIDSGDAYSINLIIDQEYFSIDTGSVAVEGFQPKAYIKVTDVPYISQDDRIVVDAITTNNGNTLVPETSFLVKNVRPDNVGMVEVILEEQ